MPTPLAATLPTPTQTKPVSQRLHETTFTDAPSGLREGVVLSVHTTAGAPTLYDIGLVDATLIGVPRILASPGDAEILPVGTHVVVTQLTRGPYILGVLEGYRDAPQLLVGDGTPGVPDQLPGDRVIRSASGNYVAALNGGTSAVYGSETSYVKAHGSGLLESVGYEARSRTAAALSTVTVTDDAVNWALRAGSSVTYHTGPLTKDAWVFRADLGSEGDILSVRVTDTQGATLSKFHMHGDGSLDIVAAVSSRTSMRDDLTVQYGNAIRTVGKTDTLEVEGARRESFGTQTTAVAGRQGVETGGARSVVVGGASSVVVGGEASRLVRGAQETHETFGKYQHVMAPVYGGPVIPTPVLKAEAAWINYTGGFAFVMQPTAVGSSFSVVTGAAFPMGVGLGVDGTAVYNPVTRTHEVIPLPPIYGAVLYEMLASWITQLLTYIDTHSHGSAVGPTTPPILPATPSLASGVASFRSIRVGYGG